MTEGLPELIAETLPKFFDGDSGTHQQWLQCRHCRGYAESEKGHRPTVTHHSWCPVGLLEKAYAALREASRPQEATWKATIYPEAKAPNNWVSAGDQWRDRPPHWPVDRDIIRNHVVENRPREASRLASPPATTEDK